MNPFVDYHQQTTRRRFFQGTGLRLGALSLSYCLGDRLLLGASGAGPVAQVHPPQPGFPHFAPKARRLIYLHMNGAPSQLDLFDYKPGLREYFDKDLPDSVRNGQRITGMTSGQSRLPVAPSMFKFSQCGQSGTWMSELVPHMQTVADDLAMIRTVHTSAINHDPACTFVMTGSEVPGKPSLLVAELRPGQREQQSASVCRLHAHLSVHRQCAGAVHAHVVQRVPPNESQWRGVARAGRSGVVHQEPTRSGRRRPPHDAERAEQAQSAEL